MKHVIIGAGAAGIAAAKTIRELRKNDEIVLISTDENVHSRCMLHKYISGERNEKSISFIQDRFFEDYNICWKKSITVSGVDTDKKNVVFDGGAESYDKLLIATGAQSVIPPIGALRSAGNVYGLRDLLDACKIRDKAVNAEKIVVIGAGLVGLDAAYAFLELGKKPVIVEMANDILALNLDRHAASTYQQKFEDAGCSFRLGRKVSDTVTAPSGEVMAVVLDTGERLACDMVIVAAGVRPASGFLMNSPIKVERSIVVDEYLATNISDIYAAGDVAGISGIWPNAQKQGEIAARNMCGEKMIYDDTFAIKNTVNFFGLPSLSVGLRVPEEGDIVEVREDKNCYEKVIMRDGIVMGVILQGDIAGSGFWQFLIKNKINVSSIPKSIWKISFADFYGIEQNGEYSWKYPA